MATVPTTPRHHSAASSAEILSNDHILRGRPELHEKELTVEHFDFQSEKVAKRSVGNQGSGSSGFHRNVEMVGLEEQYLSPDEVRFLNSKMSPGIVRFHDVTASPTSGLAGGSTKVGATRTERLQEIMNSPSWREGKSVGIGIENPFLQEETELSADESTEKEGSLSLSRNHTNSTAHITAKNAQLFLKPEACVFVANLHTSSTDTALTTAIAKVFGSFGKVWVKIRRDAKGLPYAFCQYENRENADKAIREGHNALILGRKCRTEQAKASRTAYLSRTDGKTIPNSDAVKLLAKYGKLEMVWRCTETEKEVFGLHEGMWVKFAYYEQRRLAIRAFKDNKRYRLESYHPRGLSASEGLPNSTTGIRSTQQGGTENTRRNNVDSLRATIFVGNLDDAVGIPNLVGIFCTFGEIKEVVIVSRKTGAVDGYKTHAFIEYVDPAGANRAVEHKGLTFNNIALRVERRVTSEHIAARTMQLHHIRSPDKRKFLSNGRQSNLAAKINRSLEDTTKAVANPGRGVPAVSGSLDPFGYYSVNGMAYGNIGIANPNVGNGTATAGYGQGGLMSTPMPGPNVGFNGPFMPTPATFSPFIPYGPVGNPGSAWSYPPNGPYHGHGVHPATRGGN